MITTPEQLAQVPLVRRGSRILTIGDVARVRWDHPPLIGNAVVNGGPRSDAGGREVPRRQHARRDQRGRPRAGRPAPGPARDHDRLAHLPPGDFHPHGDQQPGLRRRAGLRPGRVRAARVPVRMARGLRQPAGDPALAVRRGHRARRRGGDDQHDGAGRLRGGGRRRRGRRDHRHGEHRPAAAPVAGRGPAHDTVSPPAGLVAGGPHGDPVRHADQHRRRAARGVRGRPDRFVLPAPGAVLRARRAGLDARGPDRDPGAGHDPPPQRDPEAPGSAPDPPPEAFLQAPAHAGAAAFALDAGRRAGGDRHRPADPPEPGPGSLPVVQGARVPDALRHQAGHVVDRDDPGRRTPAEEAAGRARRDPRRRTHRAGAARRGDRRARVLRAVDQPVAERRPGLDPQTGARGRPVLPGHLPRRHDLPARKDRRDDLQQQRGRRAANPRARLRHPAGQLPRHHTCADRRSRAGRRPPAGAGLHSADPGDRRGLDRPPLWTHAGRGQARGGGHLRQPGGRRDRRRRAHLHRLGLQPARARARASAT